GSIDLPPVRQAAGTAPSWSWMAHHPSSISAASIVPQGIIKSEHGSPINARQNNLKCTTEGLVWMPEKEMKDESDGNDVAEKDSGYEGDSHEELFAGGFPFSDKTHASGLFPDSKTPICISYLPTHGYSNGPSSGFPALFTPLSSSSSVHTDLMTSQNRQQEDYNENKNFILA
ncbi:hypothetical protein PENTCL1PPCAC_30577, partial [Pristionchus entomophagus]